MANSSAEILGPPPPYDLTDPRVVRRVEQTYQLHARKSFSQHWLIDREALMTIVAAAQLTSASHVLEVGAGMGVLTAELGRRAKRVVAVEIERNVLPVLHDMTRAYPSVEVIPRDLMQISPAALFGTTPYTFVANLPYAVTALALRYYLEADHPPERMVILIQREVAARITAKPGAMSLLALSVQFYCTPVIVAPVQASCFLPPPEVDSAIVALTRHAPLADAPLRDRLFGIAKVAFAQRRKQLHNVFPGGLHIPPPEVQEWLAAAAIAPDRRPQTLSLAEWIRLAELDPRQKSANQR